MLLRLLLLGALACGAEEAAEPAATPTPVEQPEPEPEEEEEIEEEEEATPPSFTRAELDAMERPELEQACFAGSQAACDRMGH